MLSFFKKIIIIFVVGLSFSFTWANKSCAGFVINDTFDSAGDLAHYTIYPSGGSVSVENGSMILRSPYGNSFPFVVLSQELPNNFVLEVRFKYPYLGSFGTGISFAEVWPYSDPSREDNRDKFLYYFWGDPNGINLFRVLSKNPIRKIKLFTTWDNNYHVVRLVSDNNHYSFYIDGFLKDDVVLTDRKVRYLSFGNSYHTNTSNYWSQIDVDYVKVEDLDAAAVPYLSQKDSQWASEEYDHASEWAPAGHMSIADWGCALTSAAMIFQHFGVKSPSGQISTPSVLNAWLNNQSDGYVGGGLVNWIALTRYAKEAKNAGRSPTALEFESSNYDPNNTYQTPNIINLPGHFVVGYDQTTNEFKINDPADQTKTTLAKTGSNIRRIYRFIPSNTDLSYFMFTIEPEFSLDLVDDNGQHIGQIMEQGPLRNDLDATILAGKGVKTLLVAKPPKNGFHLYVKNPNPKDSNYHLGVYFYDVNGQAEVKREIQHLPANRVDIYDFYYSGQVGATKIPIKIESIQQVLKAHFDNQEMKSFFYRFVNRWLETVKQETDLQKQKEIMQALKRVVDGNSRIINESAKNDVSQRIGQWLANH